jgi:hypothetical protein
MAGAAKSLELTITLNDEDLAPHRVVRDIAIEREQPMPALVLEALREWVERQEEVEDLAAIAEARAAAEGEPTSSWRQVRSEMDRARAARRGA